MRISILGVILFIFGIAFSFGQPAIQWQRSLGGSGRDASSCIRQTWDQGYIVSGYTYSNDSQVTANHDTSGAKSDFWITKLDSLGNISWQKCLGGVLEELAWYVSPTSDSGYVIVGSARSMDGDVTPHHSNGDIWLCKLDAVGTLIWERSYGGSENDGAYFVEEIDGDGFFIVGYTFSHDGDVNGQHDSTGLTCDVWAIRLNGAGNIQWQKSIGGSDIDIGMSATKGYDGGYLVSCMTHSNDGDVIGNHGAEDIFLVKLDDVGNIIWKKCYGGTGEDWVYGIKQTFDSGYVFGGLTTSINGDVSGNHGFEDVWLVEIDSGGTIQWQKCLGGSQVDWCNNVEITDDGGFILVGETSSLNGDVVGFHGPITRTDVWVIKTDSLGNIQWQKCLGGTSVEWGTFIEQTIDHGFILSGTSSWPSNGDVTDNHGDKDYWIIKLYPAAVGINELNIEKIGVSVYPNPIKSTLNLTSKHSSIESYEIFSILSNKILERKVTNLSRSEVIDVSILSAGIYFLKVNTALGTATLKFVKE